MKNKTRRILSVLLVLCMSVSLFAGCGTKTAETGGEEEMTRGENGYLHVAYDPAGEYSVSFGAGDFFTAQSLETEDGDDMDRSLSGEEGSQAESDADETVDTDAGETAATEEATVTEETGDTDEAAVTDEAAPQEEPAVEETVSEDAVVETKEVDFSAISQDDLKVSYAKGEDLAEAEITSFNNEGGVIDISFKDPDAAENLTAGYLITVSDGANGTMVTVDFEDHSVTADVEEISAANESNEITLSMTEGSFANDVKPEDITLGQSFEDMTVSSVSANGSYLTLSLSGKPVLDPEVSPVYTAGEICVSPDAVVNGTAPVSAFIDVKVPVLGLDNAGVETSGDEVTFPIVLDGMDPDDISASDVHFEGTGDVTDVQIEGGKVLVTVKPDDGDVFGVFGDLSVGDASMVVDVPHTVVDTQVDYVESDGNDLLVTLKMSTIDGTLSDDFNEESIDLNMDYEGGMIESVNRTDDKNAEVVVRVPADDMTDTDYSMFGEIKFEEGALLNADGSSAPEIISATEVSYEEMGRERGPQDMLKDYAKYAQTAMKYGKPVYDIGSNIASGNYVGAATGAFNFFCMLFGDDGDSGPDVGKELQEIKAELAKIQDTLKSLDEKVGRIAEQTDQNRLAEFETNVGMVETYSGILEKRLAIAKEELKKDGILEPKNDEEAKAYYDKLIDKCIELKDKKDKRFVDFDTNMKILQEYFLKVAIEAGKKEAASPFYAFDDYYMQHFNFFSQSYYVRLAYYTNVDVQLKRGYNILAIYHNIPSYPEENVDISKKFVDAITAIENRDLGSSPEDMGAGKGQTYSSTFKITVVEGFVGGYLDYSDNLFADNWSAYNAKLYGKSVTEDLQSAGFNTKNATGFGIKKTKGPVAEMIKENKRYFMARSCYYTDYYLFSNGSKKNTRTYRDVTVTPLFFLLDSSLKSKGHK